MNKKKKIFVVEDEKIVAMDIKNSLKRAGYIVTGVVSTGEEALLKVSEALPDLVLMDIRLKGKLDGIETAKKIYSQFDIPIVYLTAYADDKTLERAKVTEPFGYLLKPFEDRELEITIDIAIYKHELGNKLKESENRYKRLSEDFYTLLQTIPDPLMLISEKFEVLWANKGTSLLLGKDIDGITGKNCYCLMGRDNKPCKDCPVSECFQTGNSIRKELAVHCEKVLDTRVFPIKDKPGDIKKVLVLAIDITEKLRLEAEAMQLAQLASIGELAAGVAHEINNPVNVIINYGEILEEVLRDNKIEEDIPGRIIKEGERISKIVRSLLSFSRPVDKERKSVPFMEIIRETLELTETQLRKDGIELIINISEDLPEITVNPQQLQQVFLNVLSNSRYALNMKYARGDKNKIIEVFGEKMIVREESYLRIVIKDRGTGIKKEILEKVMGPFFTTKPAGAGTGLGLSISRNIIIDHGGKFTIESSEGDFTKVIIDLPLRRGEKS